MSKRISQNLPWLKTPFIISAPMRVFSGPSLALAVSRSGGLGFIGPGVKPEDTLTDLETAQKELIALPFPGETTSLPIGIGVQLWNGSLSVAVRAVQDFKPCAAWLFAPKSATRGQDEINEWTSALRAADPNISIWLQIGTLAEALSASSSPSPPDILVVQGTEAGGHGRAHDGMGLFTLLPEVISQLRKRSSNISVVAAGGIVTGHGVAAALALGADGVCLGTRFLCATEARMKKGYQDAIIAASDGAKQTKRTTLYNQLRGTNWPDQYAPRGIVNRTYYEHGAGAPFEELKARHDEAEKAGDKGWGEEGRLATYAGAGVGMIDAVEDAGVLVERLRRESGEVIGRLAGSAKL
jgi:nitronate monooxygenase